MLPKTDYHLSIRSLLESTGSLKPILTPLGNAAWATLAVSSGTSGMIRGRMDIAHLLRLDPYIFPAILFAFSPQSIWHEFADSIACGGEFNPLLVKYCRRLDTEPTL